METRGCRVRVEYPIIAEYRYAVYPSERDWRVADRPKATIFATEVEAQDVVRVINADRDMRAVGGKATIEPIQSFDPDWCIHPGEHLKEHMLHLNLSAAEMAQRINCSLADVHALLAGERYIDRDLAKRLEAVTNRPADNWLTLEMSFREGLKMGRTWTK